MVIMIVTMLVHKTGSRDDDEDDDNDGPLGHAKDEETLANTNVTLPYTRRAPSYMRKRRKPT